LPPTNVRGTKVQMLGLKECRLTMRDLMQTVADDDSLSVGEKSTATRWASERLSQYAAEAAQDIRDEARRRATSQGWPPAVIAAIFKYNDPNAPKKKNRKAALVGVRKGTPLRSVGNRIVNPRGVYVEWHARTAMTKLRWRGKRKRDKVIAGGEFSAKGRKLGMGLGTIMEFGSRNATAFTSKPWPARPAFVPAVMARKGPAMEKLVDGYKAVVEEIVRRRATR
jgi:hypothetical protein